MVSWLWLCAALLQLSGASEAPVRTTLTDSDPVRLLVFDAIMPRQQLEFEAPPDFVRSLVEMLRAGTSLVMVGRQRLNPYTHGVEVTAEMTPCSNDGSAIVTLTARRLCEVIYLEDTEDDGSRWLGQAARARWIDIGGLDASEDLSAKLAKGPQNPHTADGEGLQTLHERSEALSAAVSLWVLLVRDGRERFDGQMDALLATMGSIPPADAINDRCLWIAALINPLPALGVAVEIRGPVMMAPTGVDKLLIVEFALQDSIGRLQKAGSPFRRRLRATGKPASAAGRGFYYMC